MNDNLSDARLLTDAEIADAVALYEHRLCRRMTPIERASVEEQARIVHRRETGLQLWLAGLTDRERLVMGMPPIDRSAL
jgi:hypothetical protein